MAKEADGTPAVAPTTITARGRGYFHEVIVELKKTTFPPLPEAWRLTTVVLVVILLVALYMGSIDVTLSWLTNHFKLIK